VPAVASSPARPYNVVGMADDGGNGNRRTRAVSSSRSPQLARELDTGVRLVQRAIEDGRLPAYRVGAHRRIRVADVQTWLAACREPPPRWRFARRSSAARKIALV